MRSPRRPARRNEEQEQLRGPEHERLIGYYRSPRTSPEERPKKKPADLRKLLYVATLINPVDHRLYTAVWDGFELEIISPTNQDEIEIWGRGFLATDDFPARETSCPRTHTPSGVVAKGKGLGLILYSGLALLAAIGNEMGSAERRKFDLPNLGPCISPSDEGPGRSTEASRWWKNQVELGFARQTDVEGGCEDQAISAGIDAEDAGYDEDRLRDELDREGDIEGISGRLEGTIYFSFCPRDLDAQIIEAETVFTKGLVFDWNDRLAPFTDDAPELTKEVLLEIDLDGVTEPHLLELFMKYLHETDATEEEIDTFLRENDLADQPRLPGIEMGEPIPYAKFKRNARRSTTRHSSTWRKMFGELVDDIM